MTNTTRQLLEDIKVLAADSEELAKLTAAQAGDKIEEIRNRIQRSVNGLTPRLAQAENAFRNKVTGAAATADGYVRAQPWTAVALAAGVALIIGMLAGRR